MRSKILKIIVLIFVFSLVFPVPVSMGIPLPPPEIILLENEITVTGSSAQTGFDLGAALTTPDGRVSLIVELTAPPLGLSPLLTQPEFELENAASAAYLMDLSMQQDHLLSQIRLLAPSAQVGQRYTAAFNGFSIRVDPAEAPALLNLDAVKRVYPDRMRSLLLDSSTQVINAPAFWSDLGGASNAGNGVRIAIIDTGIRPENPLFDGSDFVAPPGFPRGYCADSPADLEFQCNQKLISARYYTPTFEIHPDEVYSPLDIHGHGSHVAGSAAGNPVDVPAGSVVPGTTAISGVAPRAYILAYKAIFAKPGVNNAGGSDSMFLAAMDHAMLDGADIINNSWGGDQGGHPLDSPFSSAVKALNAAGIVVVFAGGNGGPDPGTITCPGCLQDVITVGASTADRIFANTLDATGPGTIPAHLVGLGALVGTGPVITGTIESQIVYSGAAHPSNILACLPFPTGTFSDTIALIPRGDCKYKVKVDHAQAAGAVAAAIFNDRPGFPTLMGGLDGTGIPSLFLSQDQGEILRDWVITQTTPTARINAQVTAVRNAIWQDTIWESSSVGPNGDPNILKPDLVAPGVNILSAAAGGEGYQFLWGSSMAAAHVTGATALLIQKHSDWTPGQIKSALTSTALQQVNQPDGLSTATPFMMGAGRLDLDQVRKAALTFSQPSFADSHCSTQCTWQAEIRSEALAWGAWWEAQVLAPPGLKVTIEPSAVVLGLGESKTFTITADVSDAPTDQWHFVEINWQHKDQQYTDAHLPLAVYAVEPDQARLEKLVDTSLAHPGDRANYTINLINDAPLTTTFALQDPIPAGASYVPGSAAGGLFYDSLEDRLFGTVELQGAKMSILTDTLYGYLSLPDLDSNLEPITCPDINCDDAAVALSPFDFYFYGQHITDLVLSTNGFIQVGVGIPNSHLPNQDLPDPAAPNNLIAPLWADYDLDGGDGIGSGQLYFALTQDPGTLEEYYVFEWKDVGLKTSPSKQFSFQVWIKKGSDQIWFVYGPQTNAVGTATVGVENPYGSAGLAHYYNGTGSAPVDGTSLKAIAQVDQAVFTYSLDITAGIGTDINNLVSATNARTGRLFQASARVQVGHRLYMPLLLR